jgi:hypothetical protein
VVLAGDACIRPLRAIKEKVMGLFGGIKDAKVSQGGNYMKPGFRFLLEIEALKAIKSRKGHDLAIAEFKVLASDCPAQPAGAQVSWCCDLTEHEAALGNVKGFLASVMNISVDAVDEAGAEGAYGPSNFLKGRRVKCETVLTKTKKGGDFTLHRYYFPTAEDLAAIKAA